MRYAINTQANEFEFETDPVDKQVEVRSGRRASSIGADFEFEFETDPVDKHIGAEGAGVSRIGNSNHKERKNANAMASNE